ncbi:hypothetical protein [Caldimonas taiwanensis]|uniref:hypothetical protein n=1 Tax=Caldimonas taiwanensis TaxID=307483 RepID=UPI0007839054|nr:hypothetical protein [Caldimonas taiwanensis]
MKSAARFTAEGRHVVVAATLALAGVLQGCAIRYAPGALDAGLTESEVRARMGPPTGEHLGPDGRRRLEFARGPYGRHTYMADLDAQGRVRQWTQVLTESHFNAVTVGMGRDELLYRLGRPSEERRIPRRNELVWSYRYESPFCLWFQVSLDAVTQRVTQTGYGVDPLCEGMDEEAHWLLRRGTGGSTVVAR